MPREGESERCKLRIPSAIPDSENRKKPGTKECERTTEAGNEREYW